MVNYNSAKGSIACSASPEVPLKIIMHANNYE
jgi:hypothetical protein